MKNILVTYVYPNALKFLPEFLESVSNQTHLEFEVILFNDGIIGLDEYLNHLPLKYKIFDVWGSVSEIRFKSFEILKRSLGENIIFQDVDDILSLNRIEVLDQKLQEYSLVCNDLSLFGIDGIIDEKVWENRLGNDFVFTYEFISDFNIVGLGNTAIKKKLLDFNFKTSSIPIALDWFIFFQILYKWNIKALFTSDCTTFYRQYEGNIAGINNYTSSPKRISPDEVKAAHYLSLREIGIPIETSNSKMYKRLNQHLSPWNLFWWE